MQFFFLREADSNGPLDGNVGDADLASVGREPGEGHERALLFVLRGEEEGDLLGKLVGGVVEGEGGDDVGHLFGDYLALLLNGRRHRIRLQDPE